MKKSKIAVLTFAIAIIFSLGFLQGISQKNIKESECTMQQVGAGMIVMAAYAADDGQAGVGAVSGVSGGYLLSFVGNSFPVWSSLGPVGWIIGGGMAL